MMSSLNPHVYAFGPFRLDLTEKELWRDDRLVALTPKAFDTLAVLVRRNGHLIQKDELLREVWPDSFVEESTLAQNIYQLRKVLGEGGGEQTYIETVPRRGYRFVAPVAELEKGAAAVAATPEGEIAVAASAARETGRRVEPRRYAAALLAVFILIAISASLWNLKGRARQPATAVFSARSIAVLPFQQIGATETELLGLGMADALILKLNNVQQIPVLPTSTIVRYTERVRDTSSIGRELGVDAVLDGTVQREGARVRVSVQLINTQDGKTVWSSQFDERYTDIFALQDSISAQVAQALASELNAERRERLAKRATSNTEAYQAYLTGVYYWNKRTKEGITKAAAYFQQAIDKDPRYAPAYAGLADTYNLMAYQQLDPQVPSAQTYEKAKLTAYKALELDETLAEPHATLGMINLDYDRDLRMAEQRYRRALELNPNYATGHLRYAWLLLGSGDIERAIGEMTRAQELDPVSPATNLALGQMLIYGRRHDDALRYLRRAADLEPQLGGCYVSLSVAYEQKGMYDEALAALERARQLSRDPVWAVAGMAYVHAVAGRRAEAQKLLSELPQSRPAEEALHLANLALIHGALGQKEKAFEFLETALQSRRVPRFILRYDPQFDLLRADPRFADSLRRNGYAFPVNGARP